MECESAVVTACRTRSAQSQRYKRPISYFAEEAIPKNAVGKIDKTAVLAAHAAATAGA